MELTRQYVLLVICEKIKSVHYFQKLHSLTCSQRKLRAVQTHTHTLYLHFTLPHTHYAIIFLYYTVGECMIKAEIYGVITILYRYTHCVQLKAHAVFNLLNHPKVGNIHFLRALFFTDIHTKCTTID